MIIYTLFQTNMKHDKTNIILTSFILYYFIYSSTNYKYKQIIGMVMIILDLYMLGEYPIISAKNKKIHNKIKIKNQKIRLPRTSHNQINSMRSIQNFQLNTKEENKNVKKVRFSDKNMVRYYNPEPSKETIDRKSYTWDNRYIQTPAEQLREQEMRKSAIDQQNISREMENPLIDNRHLIPVENVKTIESDEESVESYESDIISVSSEEY
jgi:hypothetical protein